MLLSGFYSIILNDGASGCWRRSQMHLVEMEPHQEIVLVNIYWKTNCQQKHFHESPSMDFNLLFQKKHPAFREINCQNDVALIWMIAGVL